MWCKGRNQEKTETGVCPIDEDGYPQELLTPPSKKKALTKGKCEEKSLALLIDGSPAALTKGSPAASRNSPANTVDTSFLCRRAGQRVLDPPKSWTTGDKDAGLAKAIGLGASPKSKVARSTALTKGPPMKKPAAKKKAKSTTSSLTKAPLTKGTNFKPNGGKWHRLKINAKKPERAYITAKQRPDGKFKLLVEISKKRTIHYQRVIQAIYKETESKGLSKKEALGLREELCHEA